MKMLRCPICKAELVESHQHTAAEARRLLKKKTRSLPGKPVRSPKFLGGQNFRRAQK